MRRHFFNVFHRFSTGFCSSKNRTRLLKLSALAFCFYNVSHLTHSFETEWNLGDEKGVFDQKELIDSMIPTESLMTTISEESSYKIFSGRANYQLAQEIATHLDVSLGRIIHYPSPSGEINLRILDNVRNHHVFIVQSLGPPINDNITELFLLISSLKRASAKKITCVIPYFAYMRHTELGSRGEKSLSIANLAKMLESLGCDEIITINLHINESKGFFSIPLLNLDVTNLGASYLAKKQLEDACVISLGGKKNYVQRAADFKSYLEEKGIPSAFSCLIKDELKEKELPTKKIYSHIGDDMNGKDCILVDNIIGTGAALQFSTEYLRKQGANRIFMFVPHGILTDECLKLINKIPVDEVITTNTIKEHGVYSDKIRYLSVGKMLAEAICHAKENKKLEEVRQLKKEREMMEANKKNIEK